MRKFLAALLTLCLALTLVAPIAMAEEKVTITFAFWDTNQEPGMKAIAEAYMAEHPNVTVETQVTPWAEYWTKRPLRAARCRTCSGCTPTSSSSMCPPACCWI